MPRFGDRQMNPDACKNHDFQIGYRSNIDNWTGVTDVEKGTKLVPVQDTTWLAESIYGPQISITLVVYSLTRSVGSYQASCLPQTRSLFFCVTSKAHLLTQPFQANSIPSSPAYSYSSSRLLLRKSATGSISPGVWRW